MRLCPHARNCLALVWLGHISRGLSPVVKVGDLPHILLPCAHDATVDFPVRWTTIRCKVDLVRAFGAPEIESDSVPGFSQDAP